ncbi:hypothetical protein MTO96_038155 [Rhipicephalus appendiculatus]
MYEERADAGLCNHFVGDQGAFCKHQAVVRWASGSPFPNSPKLTSAGCRNLAQSTATWRSVSPEAILHAICSSRQLCTLSSSWDQSANGRWKRQLQ